jgi:hypothetical protein
MVTSVPHWIRLGVPGTGPCRRCMCDAVPRWIFFHVRLCPFYNDSFALSHDRWIYTSTLSYIVDANVGRSSTAVATSSSFRGLFAFVAAEIAVPLQVSRHHNSQSIISNGGIGFYRRWWIVHAVGGHNGRR